MANFRIPADVRLCPDPVFSKESNKVWFWGESAAINCKNFHFDIIEIFTITENVVRGAGLHFEEYQ